MELEASADSGCGQRVEALSAQLFIDQLEEGTLFRVVPMPPCQFARAFAQSATILCTAFHIASKADTDCTALKGKRDGKRRPAWCNFFRFFLNREGQLGLI